MNAIARPSVGRAGAHRFGSALGALAVCFGTWAPARADNLDVKLLNSAPEVMKYLEDHHYQNVGVLKFRVELGKKPASFNVGPINSNMARRLQNALILVNDVDKPIGILEDPNKAAAEKKLAGYQTPAGREALFQASFRRAWGNANVKADAFLAGVVKVDPGMRKGTAVIECFDDKSPKQTAEVVTFGFDTDRTILTDLGQCFLVKRGVKVRDEDEGDKLAADDAASRPDIKGVAPDAQPTLANLSDAPVKLDILFDGAVQTLSPDKGSSGGQRVPEPQENQKISFVLTNVSKERLAAVLKINDKNTLYQETDEPAMCSKWCLEPGDSYTLNGFTVMDNGQKKEVPFKVLSAAESQAMSYSDSLGMFQLTVFRAGERLASGDDPMTVSRKLSLRGVPSTPTQRPRSYDELLRQTHKATRTLTSTGTPTKTGTRIKRGVIDVDPDAEGASKETKIVDFANPTQIMDLRIRYYEPNKTP